MMAATMPACSTGLALCNCCTWPRHSPPSCRWSWARTCPETVGTWKERWCSVSTSPMSACSAANEHQLKKKYNIITLSQPYHHHHPPLSCWPGAKALWKLLGLHSSISWQSVGGNWSLAVNGFAGQTRQSWIKPVIEWSGITIIRHQHIHPPAWHFVLWLSMIHNLSIQYWWSLQKKLIILKPRKLNAIEEKTCQRPTKVWVFRQDISRVVDWLVARLVGHKTSSSIG